MRKKILFAGIGLLLFASLCSLSAVAQGVLKPRPDAFPPVDEPAPKVLNMASSLEQMASWDRYPTYETYLAMMSRWAQEFPTLCHVDTIGTSLEGRLILSMYIEPQTDDDLYRPEFFYSSTIHGDEVTGYVMMLRLIDTLLHGYGSNPQYTDLVNRTRISINPLANPDGTYHRGNHTVQGSQRYNANGVDLNRNYPDPFGTAKEALQQENQLMIAYVSAHHFKLSANLHGGAEVMNYPWDCFTTATNPHPAADWWREVCHRFVDTSRTYSSSHFRDVTSSGVTAGGDWYVIHGGRQDYINYYHNCLEVTMEISSTKTLSTDKLPEYWRFLQHSLVNYIAEIHSLPEGYNGISDLHPQTSGFSVYPNPASDRVTLDGLNADERVEVLDLSGRVVTQALKHSGNQAITQSSNNTITLDISHLPAGTYLVGPAGSKKIIIKL